MSNKEIYDEGFNAAIRLFEMALESGVSFEKSMELVKESRNRSTNENQ